MHILSPETDDCPSWISGRGRMTVENISWSISTKECCRPWLGLNPQPPGLQSDGASNWATKAGLYTVCHPTKYCKKQLPNKQSLGQQSMELSVWNFRTFTKSVLKFHTPAFLTKVHTHTDQTVPEGKTNLDLKGRLIPWREDCSILLFVDVSKIVELF